MDKILEVKNLKVSFRTTAGTLKAVRDISFDLERGKTLAIVGESGSGKSVTSKAIIGILAGNSIVEGGEILYDGKDLLRITEDDMHSIRGDKISMIFQDPLSSLNPIVKIGRQITEAMLLKNKVNRRTAKGDFNQEMKLLTSWMIKAEPESKARIQQVTGRFSNVTMAATKPEQEYNKELGKLADLLSDVEDFLYNCDNKQPADVKKSLNTFAKSVKGIKNEYLTYGLEDKLASLSADMVMEAGAYQKPADLKNGVELPQKAHEALDELKTVIKSMQSSEKPDFAAIICYQQGKQPSLKGKSVAECNAAAGAYADEELFDEFKALTIKAVSLAFAEALEGKNSVLYKLKDAVSYYEGDFQKAEAEKYAKELSSQVARSIDPLELKKDSAAWTFESSMLYLIDAYYTRIKTNEKEEKRFASQTKRREALINRGRTVDWKVVPKNVYDMDEQKANISKVCRNLAAHYETFIASADTVNQDERAQAVIDFLQAKASASVYKVTRGMAKARAIELMDEVGIRDSRKRYYQYPFEFSGGMRQRIVIAIALAADPDILICDEPTTALDVTIQSQILELINKLKAERNLSIIFITHDLGVVANMADNIAVMYAGKVVEYGTSEDVFYDPKHPYTWALLSSMPDLDTKEKLESIPGTPPNMVYPPVGDAFADRNKYAMAIDFEQQPPMFKVSDTHYAATWLLHPDAPKVEMPKIISERIKKSLTEGGPDNG